MFGCFDLYLADPRCGGMLVPAKQQTPPLSLSVWWKLLSISLC